MSENAKFTQYRFEQLAQGIHVALARPSGQAIANAAIIDLGEQTLVFDSGHSLEAGQELRKKAEGLFDRPVNSLVISHHHPDHWRGNAAFGEETRIFGSQRTLAEMEAAARELDDLRANPGQLEADLAARKARLGTERDPRWRLGLERSIRRIEHELATLAEFRVRLPDVVFEGDQVFDGSQRRVELVHVGHAHSKDDSYLALPDDGILFLADLHFFGELPVMRDSDPVAWRAVIAGILQRDEQTLVPGHGPVSGKSELDALHAYLDMLEQQVRTALRSGGEAAARQVEPGPPFDGWLPGAMGRLEEDIEMLIRRHSPRN